MKRPVLLNYFMALLLWLPINGFSGTISSTEIVSQTTSAALSCMRWMPVGVCFWLRCSIYECSVETSIKVGHYQPDAVVSSYNELGGNPWTEIRSILGSVQKSTANGLLGSLLPVPIDSAGNRTEGSHGNRDHRNLIFRETDVIGHPLSSLSGVLAGTRTALNVLLWSRPE